MFRRDWIISIIGLGLAILVAEALLRLAPDAWLSAPVRHPPGIQETRTSLEFEYEFRTNELGLRGPPLGRTDPSQRRILIVGDSFVEGYGVSEPERFSSVLERRLRASGRPTEVINAGITGAGPREYAQLVRELSPSVAADAILLCLFANDVANTREPPSSDTARLQTAELGRRAWRKWRHHRAPRDLVERVTQEADRRRISEVRRAQWEDNLPPGLASAAEAGEFNAAVLSSALLYPQYWRESLDLASPRAQRKWHHAREYVTEILALARAEGCSLALAYLPCAFQHVADFHERPHVSVELGMEVDASWLRETSALQSESRRLADDFGVPYLDLTAALREASDQGVITNFPLDGHWTPKGHRIAGDTLAEWWLITHPDPSAS